MSAAEAPPRSLAEICAAARLIQCTYCGQKPGRACSDMGGVDGYHLDRLVEAYIRQLVTGRELLTVLVGLGAFTKATIVKDAR